MNIQSSTTATLTDVLRQENRARILPHHRQILNDFLHIGRYTGMLHPFQARTLPGLEELLQQWDNSQIPEVCRIIEEQGTVRFPPEFGWNGRPWKGKIYRLAKEMRKIPDSNYRGFVLKNLPDLILANQQQSVRLHYQPQFNTWRSPVYARCRDFILFTMNYDSWLKEQGILYQLQKLYYHTQDLPSGSREQYLHWIITTPSTPETYRKFSIQMQSAKIILEKNPASRTLDDLLKLYTIIKTHSASCEEKLLSLTPKPSEPLERYAVRLDEFVKALISAPSPLVVATPRYSREISFVHQGSVQQGYRIYLEAVRNSLGMLLNQLSDQENRELNHKNKREINAAVLKDWLEPRKSGMVEPVIKETISKLQPYKFFSSPGLTQKVRGLQGSADKWSATTVFQELQRSRYYHGENISEDYVDALERIIIGLNLPLDFDEIRIEPNSLTINNLVNAVGSCTAVNGKYEKYGFHHLRDPHIGIIAANVYKNKQYQETVGQAFLVECKDREGKKILYVDGVLVNPVIAAVLQDGKTAEPYWCILYTKAILQTAVNTTFENIIMNTSHKTAQVTIWQYLQHWAELAGLKRNKEYL